MTTWYGARTGAGVSLRALSRMTGITETLLRSFERGGWGQPEPGSAGAALVDVYEAFERVRGMCEVVRARASSPAAPSTEPRPHGPRVPQ